MVMAINPQVNKYPHDWQNSIFLVIGQGEKKIGMKNGPVLKKQKCVHSEGNTRER